MPHRAGDSHSRPSNYWAKLPVCDSFFCKQRRCRRKRSPGTVSVKNIRRCKTTIDVSMRVCFDRIDTTYRPDGVNLALLYDVD